MRVHRLELKGKRFAQEAFVAANLQPAAQVCASRFDGTEGSFQRIRSLIFDPILIQPPNVRVLIQRVQIMSDHLNVQNKPALPLS